MSRLSRTAFFVAFGALVAVACADSSTPEGGGSLVKGDASAEDAGAYDSGYGSTTEDSGATGDTGAPVTDAGTKETSPTSDAGTQPDTGTAAAGACDTASPAYDFVFAAILVSGDPLPPECSTGCQATECCYDSGSGMYCLPQ
jgi:hypothetical protein